MSAHLLVVDDDSLLRRSLAFSLEKAGFQASTAATAEDALAQARNAPPDLVLLDIGLPGMDGLEALRRFRDQWNCPIVFLTARRRDLEQALGLELGADDYVTKPFDLDVLLARIRAILRRTGPREAPRQTLTVVVGDMQIDPLAHTVTVGGRPVDLSPREFEMLHVLALDAGHMVSADDLLTRVWGAEYAGEPQVVYVHIRRLREKLEADPSNPQRIVTIRGIGYKLEPKAD